MSELGALVERVLAHPPVPPPPLELLQRRVEVLQRRTAFIRAGASALTVAALVLGMANLVGRAGGDDLVPERTGGGPAAVLSALAGDVEELDDLVANRPDLFVATQTRPSGDIVVALNPGNDANTWRDALLAELGLTQGVDVVVCPRTTAELNGIASAVASRTWTARSDLAILISLDAASCSVKVTSAALTDAEVAELASRFGPSVTVDRSDSFQRAPGSSS